MTKARLNLNVDAIASGEWGHRTSGEFLDAILESSEVLKRFSIRDGVKHKDQIPVFGASLTFHDNLCAFDPNSSVTVTEREGTVDSYKWDFLNCKTALESTFRSEMLKKGQVNPETMDAELRQWVFMYFAGLVSEKVLNLFNAKLHLDLIAGDEAASTIKPTIADGDFGVDKIIQTINRKIVPAIPKKVRSALFGNSNAKKPVVLMGTDVATNYMLATSELYTQSPQGAATGEFLPVKGMEVIVIPSLHKNTMIVTDPENIAILTDDYGDTKAIQSKYEEELNSDKIWGQFKMGTIVLQPEYLVLAVEAATLSSMETQYAVPSVDPEVAAAAVEAS